MWDEIQRYKTGVDVSFSSLAFLVVVWHLNEYRMLLESSPVGRGPEIEKLCPKLGIMVFVCYKYDEASPCVTFYEICD